ncbi:MAG: tetratricopeptide repeat protein [Acidobacteriota bacterium]
MSYSVREVAAMLGLTAAQIRSYASNGFLSPEHDADGELRFAFHDLVILRTASELTAANISPRKVKRALDRLREQLPAGRSITGVRIAADGERVIVRDGHTVWNPESGQSLFDFSVSEIAAVTAPHMLRVAEEARGREEELDAEQWYELGCELELTNSADAQDAYHRALRLDASHADAHVNLGRLLHEAGAPADAARHYELALKADPTCATAAFNLGVALEDLRRPDSAAAAYRRAIDLDGSNADAHYNLAGIFERRGEKAEAVQHLKEYRKLVRK